MPYIKPNKKPKAFEQTIREILWKNDFSKEFNKTGYLNYKKIGIMVVKEVLKKNIYPDPCITMKEVIKAEQDYIDFLHESLSYLKKEKAKDDDKPNGFIILEIILNLDKNKKRCKQNIIQEIYETQYCNNPTGDTKKEIYRICKKLVKYDFIKKFDTNKNQTIKPIEFYAEYCYNKILNEKVRYDTNRGQTEDRGLY